MKPILVGFDWSAGAEAAQCWALDEGMRHRTAVYLVHAVEPPLPPTGAGPIENRMRRLAADAYDWGALGIEVSGEVIDGPAARSLCERSADASAFVVGARGQGGFRGLRLGSVSHALVTHARCPVVVVNGAVCPTSRRPVAVGVDESTGGRLAVASAFREADARGVELLAVRAWEPIVGDMELQRMEEDLTLASGLKEWRDRYPHVPVVERLMPAGPAHALVVVSREAQLTVVGARGRGGFPGLALGSVAYQVVEHALSPVMVAR